MPFDVRDAEAKDAILSRAVAEMNAPMREALQIIGEAIEDNFSGEWDGVRHWSQLAPRTVADRVAHGFPGEHPILTRTGDLRGSMVGSSDNASAELGPREDIEYARFHETGTARMPARPFLRLAVQDEQRIEDAILDHLTRHEG